MTFRFMQLSDWFVRIDLLSPVSGLSMDTGIKMVHNGYKWEVLDDGVYEASGMREAVDKHIASMPFEELEKEFVQVYHDQN